MRYWLTGKPKLRLPGGFKIIFITSVSADTASINRGDYCISKAGLSMAAQLWAARLAADKIQVFELRPGIMATDMTASVKEKYDQLIARDWCRSIAGARRKTSAWRCARSSTGTSRFRPGRSSPSTGVAHPPPVRRLLDLGFDAHDPDRYIH